VRLSSLDHGGFTFAYINRCIDTEDEGARVLEWKRVNCHQGDRFPSRGNFSCDTRGLITIFLGTSGTSAPGVVLMH
jgi:hypothetical protein